MDSSFWSGLASTAVRVKCSDINGGRDTGILILRISCIGLRPRTSDIEQEHKSKRLNSQSFKINWDSESLVSSCPPPQ